jgi:hypothetical protein
VIADVYLDDKASPAELAGIRETFRKHGFDVEPEANYMRKSADVLPWVVVVVLLTPIGSFFRAFGERAGQDAYDAVQAWVREVWEARAASEASEGSLAVEDSDGTHLILSTNIPPEALAALSEIDWAAQQGRYLTWDEVGRVWRDPVHRE